MAEVYSGPVGYTQRDNVWVRFMNIDMEILERVSFSDRTNIYFLLKLSGSE